jgi:metal-responsive CopG/Arc/MetJ family transcriptional regulator
MRITLTIPAPVAKRLDASIPRRQRSRVITRLLRTELEKRERSLEAACRAANRDRALQREVDEWQSFDDALDE